MQYALSLWGREIRVRRGIVLSIGRWSISEMVARTELECYVDGSKDYGVMNGAQERRALASQTRQVQGMVEFSS